jgi:formylglycine-generating enzyme required for sulfatase activity
LSAALTLEGIDQAISDLGYKRTGSPKARLIHAMRASYRDPTAIATLQKIPPDVLIRSIWGNGGSAAEWRSRRKNLASVRSSVNTDLKKLFHRGRNPEGVIIGANFVFAMSDDAKDRILSSLSQALQPDPGLSLTQIADMLTVAGRYLEKMGAPDLEHLKAMINSLGDLIDAGGFLPPAAGASFTDSEEVVETDLRDEIVEIVETDALDKIVETAGEEDIPASAAASAEPLGPDSFKDPAEVVEIGLPLDPLEEMIDDLPMDSDDLRNPALLAEKFDGFLGVMERYYNQYLLVAEEKYVIGSRNPVKGELKAHSVRLPAFYMGKFPVTNALFEVFVDRTGYVTTAERCGEAAVYRGRFQKAVDPETGQVRSVWRACHRRQVVPGACWYHPFGPGSGLHAKRNHPVVQVSLQDALAFAAWTGKRLPREVEWEAAARTAEGFALPWGARWREDCCNTEETGIGDTTPVDRFAEGANALGLSDCLGNVLEWTLDSSPPLFEAAGASTAFIAKGGCWISDAGVRLYSRFRFPADFCANILGFRCLAD